MFSSAHSFNREPSTSKDFFSLHLFENQSTNVLILLYHDFL
ncbi:hypothetical protein HMPREF0813_01655 [Streptococcus anginosus F0211]|uniref:Uncharacterized protein n=1 Tax=Streptococcus anginosus F0211 TaxID=706437 RepID=E6J311_STRAP|nr:hypothetical protein HMPREF0813_01655 [Streptococcus anginosus F0211]